MSKFKDLTGQKFGRLTVISFVGKTKGRKAIYLCRCDCGKEKTVLGDSLTSGKTKSCGCIRVERNREGHATKHGGKHTKLYKIWCGIKSRCANLNNPYYGGKGVKVCDEWYNSFEAFREWALANGYEDGLTIERIDNEKGYCPENCCWITKKKQANHRGNNLTLTINGKTQTLAQHTADPEINIYNLKEGAVRSRKKRGWSEEKIFSTPVEGRPIYTINGKIQTLIEHVNDLEINIHGLEYRTVERRINGLGWTPEKAFSTPLRGKRK